MMKTFLALIAAISFFAVGAIAQETYTIDTKTSNVRWEGKKVVGGHWGDVKFHSGSLLLRSGKLIGGNFSVDLKTIDVLDIDESGGKSKLEGHLKSDDFFSVDKYPHAKFKIIMASEISGAKKGQPNYNISGEMTIRDKTHSISFPAIIDVSNNNISAKADFSIDRTKWDIKYNSGNFFKNLGDRMIKDEILFNIDIKAIKK